MEQIHLAYYGYIFDASGYGNAARSYIHALHQAGVRLSVVDLAGRKPQIHDELVESLVHKPIKADFHLFHGIPPQWARLAFREPRGIGMTVWETDTMPTQWRNPLNQMLEVWLPCEFNCSVFGKSLERPVFRLPHPVAHNSGNTGNGNGDVGAFSQIPSEDFVFYSIFEWQDRKCPHGLLSSFLEAFSSSDQVTLAIKTNHAAADVARAALEEARRVARSDARVLLFSDGWSNPQIDALHARGNCYVSLHRGEGWNYPLFDAASRGIPVVSTGYSGPMDYLTPADHFLVRYRICPVRQPYLYYHPEMQWADPDLTHASELMRWIYENQPDAKAKAARAATNIRDCFSLRHVGETAKARLLVLMRRTQPDRWRQLPKQSRFRDLAPPIPIPGEWYDQDYFENGLKSNWSNGYKWSAFSGLFQDTARFLTSIFPKAQSFLDVGCAKGFLVRALREQRKEAWGIDASPWAIRNTERASAPFVRLASLDTYAPEKAFDVLLVFSVLESLTEPQIQGFLQRFRHTTRHAILAVITSPPESSAPPNLPNDSNDISHITLRPREWWDQQFHSAGWFRGDQNFDLQRQCQAHPLPARMNWNVYAYFANNPSAGQSA